MSKNKNISEKLLKRELQLNYESTSVLIPDVTNQSIYSTKIKKNGKCLEGVETISLSSQSITPADYLYNITQRQSNKTNQR